MENVLDVVLDHVDVASLICLFNVSSTFRSIVSNPQLLYYTLYKANFKQLAKKYKWSTFDVIRNSFSYINEHVQQRNACGICWKKNAPPIRMKDNSISHLCVSCEGNMLWERSDILNFRKSKPKWKRKSVRSLYSRLVIAKKRNTKKHLYWKSQVKNLCIYDSF